MPKHKDPKDREQEPEDDLQLEDTPVETSLDPHLQDVIIASQPEKPFDVSQPEKPFDTSSVLGEADDGSVIVDIIAKLQDPDIAVPGLQVVRSIGQIVTGTVRVLDIEAVRAHPNVISLKRATKLHPEIQFSVPEIRCAQDQLAETFPDGTSHDGQGVIVGVVDYGCDFVHNNFRHPDGTTRLLFLWDQQGAATSISPQGYGYGRELTAAQINQALQAAAPAGAGQPEQPQRAYQHLAYQPIDRAHGTHVMDIAAGNGRATGHRGVAPGGDLIFVQVAAGDYEDDESFGNSRRLLEAVDYIFEKAKTLGRPAVVNVSLGTHGGPHDGSTLVEQGFDTLLAQPDRAIVIAAGNSRDRRSHASGQVTTAQPRVLGWEIRSGDQTTNEMEVWYAGAQGLQVTLISPAGTRLGPVTLGNTKLITRQGRTVGRIIHRRADPNNGDNQIDILLDSSLPTGTWRVELHTDAAEPVMFHAWIERDDYGQSAYLAADDDPTHTLGSISCGARTIAVGSYNAKVPARDLAPSSGEGPTRDGKQKPEVSAPGMGINAARSLSQEAIPKSGTSMASPHVTGLIALLMQAAGPNLSIADIRRLLASAARSSPPGQVGWHGQYGMGRVDGIAMLQARLATAIPTPIEQPGAAVSAVLNGGAAAADDAALSHLIETLSRAANTLQSRIRIAIEVEPIQTK